MVRTKDEEINMVGHILFELKVRYPSFAISFAKATDIKKSFEVQAKLRKDWLILDPSTTLRVNRDVFGRIVESKVPSRRLYR